MFIKSILAITIFMHLCTACSDGGRVAAEELSGEVGLNWKGEHITRAGKPILLLGDSVTQGWMELGENFAQEKYLEALADHGMNLVMIWSFIGTDRTMQKADERIGYDAPEMWPWLGSPDTADFDLTRFNQRYFDRLKAFVSHAEKLGIVVLITVHDGWVKGRFKAHPFNKALGNGPLNNGIDYVMLDAYLREMPSEYDPSWSWKKKNQYFQERFCDKLIAELKPFGNVIYEIFNEGEWYNPQERHQHEQHFLQFFKARCNNLLLSNTDHLLLDNPWEDSKVDVVTFHGKPWTGWFGKFATLNQSNPRKPILRSEPVPGWKGDFPVSTIRQSVWEQAFSKSGWVAQNDLSFGWDRNSGLAAKSEIRDQAYHSIGICSKFFNNLDIPFWRMEPQGALSSTGICLAEPAREYLVYAPEGGTLSVDLSVDPDAAYMARWFNPRNGSFTEAFAVNGGKAQVICPDSNDWVLHLVRNR